MEEQQKLVKEIRETLALASQKVETLKEFGDVELSIEIGSDAKTVSFNKIKILEFEVKAISKKVF